MAVNCLILLASAALKPFSAPSMRMSAASVSEIAMRVVSAPVTVSTNAVSAGAVDCAGVFVNVATARQPNRPKASMQIHTAISRRPAGRDLTLDRAYFSDTLCPTLAPLTKGLSKQSHTAKSVNAALTNQHVIAISLRGDIAAIGSRASLLGHDYCKAVASRRILLPTRRSVYKRLLLSEDPLKPPQQPRLCGVLPSV